MTTPRFTFPKSARLRKRFEYQRLLKEGRRLHATLTSLNYRVEGKNRPRLGITVSRQYGKAHLRNRFKRLVREAFRELQHTLPLGLEVNVSPKQTSEPLTKNSLTLELKLLEHAQSPAKKSRRDYPG